MQIKDVKLAGHRPIRRARRHVDDFGDEIEKPEHIKQPEERVGHRLQRLIVPQAVEHLPGENGQQKKEQHRHFEVVGTRRAEC